MSDPMEDSKNRILAEIEAMRAFINLEITRYQRRVANLARGLQIIENARIAMMDNDSQEAARCTNKLKRLTQLAYEEDLNDERSSKTDH